jgi:DNA-binding beta-propeller fold protein YncE
MNYLNILMYSSLAALALPAPPSILQFAAAPAQLEAGQPATLAWRLGGGAATVLTLEDPLTGEPARDVRGRTVQDLPGVLRRQTFTLRARNAGGATETSITLVARGLSLLAGDLGGPGSRDGEAAGASFHSPAGLALDRAGNLIVADTYNATIRRITPEGRVTTLAGQSGQEGTRDGSGPEARFREPSGVAVDAATGVIYVADAGNHAIRALAPDGQVTTFAGAAGQRGVADGAGAAARFDRPQGVAVGTDGTVYVADTNNQTIRRISAKDGTVTTLAGAAGLWGFQDGPGTSASFGAPWAVAVDAAQNLYVADTFNHAIRKITAGMVTTVAGEHGEDGCLDGDVATARFNYPMGVLCLDDGTLLVCDSGNGRIRTLRGREVGTYGGVDSLKSPEGMAMDPAGHLYVADTSHHAIRRFDPGRAMTPWAGGPLEGRRAFGEASKIVVDPITGEGFVADGERGQLRRLSVEGRLRILELQGASALKGVGGLALDGQGTLFAANHSTGAILKITASGAVTTLAGPEGGMDCGEPGSIVRPLDLALDSGGNLYVTDADDDTVKKVTPEGTVTCLAGTPGTPGHRDGRGEEAKFVMPSGIVVTTGDQIIVVDQGSHTIRKISPTGFVTTLAGKPGEPGGVDGVGDAARFNHPQGVAADAYGNLFVADSGNGAVRKITPEGLVTTVAGVLGQPGARMGPLPGGLSQPTSVAVTPAGDLLVVCANGLVQVTDP